ncbi:hypothetical protein NBRC116586_14050 [Pseudooceanicola nitratireducens]
MQVFFQAIWGKIARKSGQDFPDALDSATLRGNKTEAEQAFHAIGFQIPAPRRPCACGPADYAAPLGPALRACSDRTGAWRAAGGYGPGAGAGTGAAL